MHLGTKRIWDVTNQASIIFVSQFLILGALGPFPPAETFANAQKKQMLEVDPGWHDHSRHFHRTHQQQPPPHPTPTPRAITPPAKPKCI
jgi:hypothetical protein